MTMQSCKGCQFLVHEAQTVCRVNDRADVLRPTIEEQRSATGLCGPEALLYQPTYWHRIRTWWTNGPI